VSGSTGSLQAQHVDGCVARDPEQPREDAAAARVVAGRVAPGADENLLGHVLRGGAILQHRHRKSVHRALKAANERSRGVGVSGCHPCE
jgi:hypothetical protein